MSEDENMLRTARMNAKMSLTEMARCIGLSKGYLSGIENGKEATSTKVVEGYEQVLGIRLESSHFVKKTKSVLFYGRAKEDVLCGIRLRREALEEELREVREASLPEHHQAVIARVLEQTQEQLKQRIADLIDLENVLTNT